MKCFLGIDSGTQSTKAIVVSEEGKILSRGQAPHEMITGLPVGHAEQDPGIWVNAMITAVREALSQLPKGACVVAMGVSGQQHGFVPIDEDGNVIRPAKLWCDTSTTAQVDSVYTAMGGEAAYREAIGNRLATGFTASKILWLKDHEPENFDRLATVLLPHDYLNFWLTGNRSMEPGDASGTGLMNVKTREWSKDVAKAIDSNLLEKLPKIQSSSAPSGHLTAEAAEALGLSKKTMVSSGGGDNMMGAFGTGNVVEGKATVSLGTSGTIYVYTDTPAFDPKGDIATFCSSSGGWLPLLCTMNVTSSTNLVSKMFSLGIDSLNKEASAIPPGSDGLFLLPYLEGERTPDVPDGTGVWFGARPGNASAGHYARAAMEGATLGLGYGWQQLKAMGLSFEEVRLTGGGSKSALWRQIVADVLDCPVVNTTEPEGAAFGAALQACWIWIREQQGTSDLSELANLWVKVDHTTRAEPHPESVAIYREYQELHNKLSSDLRGCFHEHRRLLP